MARSAPLVVPSPLRSVVTAPPQPPSSTAKSSPPTEPLPVRSAGQFTTADKVSVAVPDVPTPALPTRTYHVLPELADQAAELVPFEHVALLSLQATTAVVAPGHADPE